MKTERAFTLIEILISISIITVIIGLGLFMSMDAFRGYSRRSERDTLVSVLQRARSRALANVNQHQWGVCLDASVPSSPSYVIFSGANYAGAISKDIIPANPSVVMDLSGAPSFPCASNGIVFAQLTGDTTNATIGLTQSAITATVSTNQEGAILW